MFSLPELLSLAEQTQNLTKKRGYLVALNTRSHEFRTEEEGQRYRAIVQEVKEKLEQLGFTRHYTG